MVMYFNIFNSVARKEVLRTILSRYALSTMCNFSL